MKPKQRERKLSRIEEIEKAISDLKNERTTLYKQLEDDDKQRLLGAVTRKGLTIEAAIGIIETTATETTTVKPVPEKVPFVAQNEKSERSITNETKDSA